MRDLVLVGACYLDTILSVPYYPAEDTKLRATSVQVRRGGNCPNALEVLRQLLEADDGRETDALTAHLVTCLPAADAAATRALLASFGRPTPLLAFDHCLFRAGHATPASCYILRAAATGSRTSVNANGLPDMTAAELQAVADALGRRASTRSPTSTNRAWWHFEGRLPEAVGACIAHLRQTQPTVTVSVEVETPGRAGLRELAAAADVVFFSKIWAEDQGYADAAACLRGEASQLPRATLLFCTWGAQGASAWLAPQACLLASPVPSPLPPSWVKDSVGAGDTFVAGILYRLACDRAADSLWERSTMNTARAPVPDAAHTVDEALVFAVALATRKVQTDGFGDLTDARPGVER